MVLKAFILTIISMVLVCKPQNYSQISNENHYKANPILVSSNYFPVTSKKTLIYDSDFGEAELKITKEKNLDVFTYSGEDFIYRQKLLINNDGVFVKETYQNITLMLILSKEGKLTYNEPLPRIKFPFEAGKKWSWKGKEFDDDDTYILDVNSRIDNIEKVTVPAGTFDAIKLVTNVKSTKGTKSFVTEWYAKDIGLIKMVAVVEGGGVIGAARDILGLGEIVFELKEIKNNK